MTEDLKIRMSEFGVSTFVAMVNKGAYIPVVVPPKYTPTGKPVDEGSEEEPGKNYRIPLGQLPMRISQFPLTGDGSAERPFTIDLDVLKEIVTGIVEEVIGDSIDTAVRKYLQDAKFLGYADGSDNAE